jgi:type VI protein secretion system component VasA
MKKTIKKMVMKKLRKKKKKKRKRKRKSETWKSLNKFSLNHLKIVKFGVIFGQ